MKFLTPIVVLLVGTLGFAADTCGVGPFPFKVSTDKKQHPEPQADANSAVIYVLNDSNVLKSVITLAVDGKWVGATRRHDYFAVLIPAGTHTLCSEFHLGGVSIKPGALSIKVEAGKIYNIEQFLAEDGGTNRVRLRNLDDAEAKLLLPKLHLSVSSQAR